MYQETPSSVPYIGCRISLISKSDIRYEGVLSNINPEDATVALEQGSITAVRELFDISSKVACSSSIFWNRKSRHRPRHT